MSGVSVFAQLPVVALITRQEGGVVVVAESSASLAILVRCSSTSRTKRSSVSKSSDSVRVCR